MSRICLWHDSLNCGTPVNEEWTFGHCSFSSSAFHSILALKAVNTVIQVRTSPSDFLTRTEEHIPVSFFEPGDVKIEAETSEHWKLHGSLLMVMALNRSQYQKILHMSIYGPDTSEEDNSCNNSCRIFDQINKRFNCKCKAPRIVPDCRLQRIHPRPVAFVMRNSFLGETLTNLGTGHAFQTKIFFCLPS